jgi:hypothetical protein
LFIVFASFGFGLCPIALFIAIALAIIASLNKKPDKIQEESISGFWLKIPVKLRY